MKTEITLAGRKIGLDHPPFIICELSGNHNGSLDRALKMMDVAAATGCDAIKIQTYEPDTLTIDCEKDDFKIRKGLWAGRTLYDLYTDAYTPYQWHPALFKHAKELGVTLFSTPFDKDGADLLEELGSPAFKIASFEAIDFPLIAHVASKKKPMIISTGLANLGEVQQAVAVARDNGCNELAILHCISSYPAPIEESNIKTISHLAETFNTVGGLSDHTKGTAVSVAAVALGASIIEKHFTLSRADGGPDADFSLEPDEFKKLCEDCKTAYLATGNIDYNVKASEKSNVIFRRSLYVTEDIAQGQDFSNNNVRSIRPGFGLAPKHLPTVLKSKATRFLQRGEPLDWSMIDQKNPIET